MITNIASKCKGKCNECDIERLCERVRGGEVDEVTELKKEIMELRIKNQDLREEKYKLRKNCDYWELEAKRYCAQIGEIRILAGQEPCDE